MRERIYHTYRVMVALNDQIGIFDDDYSNMKMTDVRHSVFSKVYSDLIKKKRIKIYYNNKDYHLFVSKELKDGVLLCKLSKEEILKLYKITDEDTSDIFELDIEENIVDNHPFVYVIIHLDKQAFLVEKIPVFTEILINVEGLWSNYFST